MVTSCRGLLASSFPDRVELDLLDSTQISVPPPSLPVRIAFAARRVAIYLWRLERRRPDAVLLFAALGSSLLEKSAMAAYARVRGIPVLLFPRGGGIIDEYRSSSFTRWWVRLAFTRATAMLCQSQRWHDFAVRDLGFDPHLAPIVPNWTATPDLIALGLARKRDRVGLPVRMLFLGWLDREKGVVELLEACRELVISGQAFELDVAGEGNQSAQSRAYVTRHGLHNRIRFRGWLRDGELRAAIAWADVLVLPSWAEGLPNAMIEAMAARLAVVVTGVGSVRDVVVDGEDALIVPPRDARALESALGRVLSDRSLLDRLADAGHAKARARFGVEPAVERLIAVLGELLPERDSRAVE